jgi:carboxylesterase type B
MQRYYLGQEDCLHLNIYAPEMDPASSDLLPVMFWIHGGGWFAGDGTTQIQGPDRLLDEDVVSLLFFSFPKFEK